MNSALISLPKNYWDNLVIQDSDLEFLYGYLLEIETPQSPNELTTALIMKRISDEKENLEQKQLTIGKTYLPRESYEVGESIVFPGNNWQNARVTSVRRGNNPEIPSFSVIEVEFETGDKKQYASDLESHSLNQTSPKTIADDLLDSDYVISKYGAIVEERLVEDLRSNPDLVQIAGKWFPRALLVDVNIGHLNLAEAVLDEANGGPLSTSAILEQIELPTDVNLKLTEFSLNLALQEDGRFDEVGPTGEVLWFLRRLEPNEVKDPPISLRYTPSDYNPGAVQDWLHQFDSLVFDELQPSVLDEKCSSEEISVSLSYPHWRAGTLPLCNGLQRIFPSALESPRIRFTFCDIDSNQKFSGWVVRPFNYVFGLREWYLEQGLFPGVILHVSKSKQPGEVLIRAEKHRATREWMRTILVGADGGIVFAVLKQLVSANFDERMAIAIPDPESLDQIWQPVISRKVSLETTLFNTMRELSKLSPQGHVHAQDLYASVNAIRRCPPGPILHILKTSNKVAHLGDLYFRLLDNSQENFNDE